MLSSTVAASGVSRRTARPARPSSSAMLARLNARRTGPSGSFSRACRASISSTRRCASLNRPRSVATWAAFCREVHQHVVGAHRPRPLLRLRQDAPSTPEQAESFKDDGEVELDHQETVETADALEGRARFTQGAQVDRGVGTPEDVQVQQLAQGQVVAAGPGTGQAARHGFLRFALQPLRGQDHADDHTARAPGPTDQRGARRGRGCGGRLASPPSACWMRQRASPRRSRASARVASAAPARPRAVAARDGSIGRRPGLRSAGPCASGHWHARRATPPRRCRARPLLARANIASASASPSAKRPRASSDSLRSASSARACVLSVRGCSSACVHSAMASSCRPAQASSATCVAARRCAAAMARSGFGFGMAGASPSGRARKYHAPASTLPATPGRVNDGEPGVSRQCAGRLHAGQASPAQPWPRPRRDPP